MKHILFIGYSNLLRRRILPILSQTNFTSISIAKHESQNWENDQIGYTKFNNFEDAFNDCKADIVYISTINSSHYELALKALNNGFNVIVDKPSTLCYNDTKHLVEVAKFKKVLICESTVYLNHPQFFLINEFLSNRNFKIKHITIHFSFPPLNQDNFRYKKNAGGGAIFDTGPYVASIGRYFFNEVPSKASVNVLGSNSEVETAYSVLLKYSEGRSIMAFCSFCTEYINRINILGDHFLIDLDRVFTIPDDCENKLIIRSRNESETIIAKKGNSFLLFLNEINEALDSKNYNRFYQNMLIDSETIQKLINNK